MSNFTLDAFKAAQALVEATRPRLYYMTVEGLGLKGDSIARVKIRAANPEGEVFIVSEAQLPSFKAAFAGTPVKLIDQRTYVPTL